MTRGPVTWDIVGFGVAAVDDVFVTETFPVPGGKTLACGYMRVGGGQTATAFVAASRLGCRCFYGGHLGANDLSDHVRGVFDHEGIGRRQDVQYPEAMPAHTLVIVQSDTGERSNAADLTGVRQPEMGEFERALILNARCLFVDQSIPEFQVEAARIALAAGIPVVGDLEGIATGVGRELYLLTDHIIVPFHVAAAELGAANATDAVGLMMRDNRRALACVTDGAKGAWYMTAEDPGAIIHQPAFPVSGIVDTNGCGDVFHGAYAAALIQGLPVETRIRRAAAAAAMKTRRRGGQTGAPTTGELEEFLKHPSV